MLKLRHSEAFSTFTAYYATKALLFVLIVIMLREGPKVNGNNRRQYRGLGSGSAFYAFQLSPSEVNCPLDNRGRPRCPSSSGIPDMSSIQKPSSQLADVLSELGKLILKGVFHLLRGLIQELCEIGQTPLAQTLLLLNVYLLFQFISLLIEESITRDILLRDSVTALAFRLRTAISTSLILATALTAVSVRSHTDLVAMEALMTIITLLQPLRHLVTRSVPQSVYIDGIWLSTQWLMNLLHDSIVSLLNLVQYLALLAYFDRTRSTRASAVLQTTVLAYALAIHTRELKAHYSKLIATIHNLKTVLLLQDTRIDFSWVCTICFEGASSECSENTPCTLKCGHTYHAQCLVLWCHHQSFCPVCHCNISLNSS